MACLAEKMVGSPARVTPGARIDNSLLPIIMTMEVDSKKYEKILFFSVSDFATNLKFCS